MWGDRDRDVDELEGQEKRWRRLRTDESLRSREAAEGTEGSWRGSSGAGRPGVGGRKGDRAATGPRSGGERRRSRKRGHAAGERGVSIVRVPLFICARGRGGVRGSAHPPNRRRSRVSARWDKAAVLGLLQRRPARGGRRTSGLSLAQRGEGAACLRGWGNGWPHRHRPLPAEQLREGGARV